MKRFNTYLFIGLFSLILFIIQVSAQTQWTKDPGNPVFVVGESGEWDDTWVSWPWVIHDSTQFIMYYTGFPDLSPSGAQVGRAISPDGITWTREEGNPVIMIGPGGGWDDATVTSGPVIFDGLEYKMWYNGYDGVFYRIGLATSTDGIIWEKYGDNPVFNLGGSGQWDNRHVWPVSVIVDQSLYKMWYVGTEGGTYICRIGYATSSDGINWDRHEDNPVLDIGESGAWDEDIPNAYVLFNGSFYEMWYQGHNGLIGKIGYATSPDGIDWPKDDRNPNPILVGERHWEITGVGLGSVLIHDSVYKMWYFGETPSQGQIGYATDSIPTNISPNANHAIPKKYSLSQNFPNPFNPTTIINYELQITNNVDLSIYNLLGRRVATLVNEKQNAGYHQVQWDASGFASGIYYYRIEAGEFHDVKNMILIK